MFGALRIYRDPAVRRMLPLGFSSGLPYLLVFGTMSFRLREAGVNLATIGFLNVIPWAYAIKWLWAPLVDRLPLPWLTQRLGRRRSWLLLAQSVAMLGLVAMALIDPHTTLWPFVACAALTAFASATQDIALDAYRIESAATDLQAALAAAYQAGYRGAMIWASAGALEIASLAAPGDGYRPAAWTAAYLAMAASMAVGMVAALHAREAPAAQREAGASPAPRARRLREALIGPFADFFGRYGWRAAPILAFVSTFRISDIVLAAMASPFYHDMGFSKAQVAAVSGINGVAMFLAGATAGGTLVSRHGLRPVLIAAAALSPCTMLLYMWLSLRGHDLALLASAVSADNFIGGVASSAFIAYLSSLTSARFTATQYALFSSVMLMLPKAIAVFSGVAVERFGYAHYFIGAALLGLPALALAGTAARLAAGPAYLVSKR